MGNERKLRVLLATGIYPPDIGGPATYSKVLAEELPKRSCEIKVVTYGETVDCNASEHNNIDIVRISRQQNILMRYFGYFAAVWKFASWADVVYVQDSVSSGLPVWLASKLKQRFYLMKIVGDHAWEQARQRHGVKDSLDDFQKNNYGIKISIMRFVEHFTARGAKTIITPSQYLKKVILLWGVSEKRISVVYNAVKNIEAGPEKYTIRKKLGLKGEILLSAGRLVAWKGFSTLINIMPQLIDVSPDYVLLIAGDGPERSELERCIKLHNLEKNVYLLGQLNQDMLWNYMRAANIFILNTQYEGLPHVIIEAMNLNLPVIASNIGGNIEVIDDNINGLLVEHDNKPQIIEAILKLRKDQDLLEKLKHNARLSTTIKFSKERMINDVYAELRKFS